MTPLTWKPPKDSESESIKCALFLRDKFKWPATMAKMFSCKHLGFWLEECGDEW